MKGRAICVWVILLFGLAGSGMAGGPVAVSPGSGIGARVASETEVENGSIGPLGTEGASNTFYGLDAGHTMSQPGILGSENTFIGRSSGYSSSGANYNTFVGYYTGYSNTTGSNNTFIGDLAGRSNTAGNSNTFLGEEAGYFNTTGDSNTFVGKGAGLFNSTGDNNTYLGLSAGLSNTTGSDNTFLGRAAGFSNTAGYFNTFLGLEAGTNNITGIANTFVGRFAGRNSNGSGNTFLGNEAGHSNASGWRSTMVGEHTGWNNNGGGNVFIGWKAGYNATASNRLYIDNSDTSLPLIYGEFDNRILTVNGNLEVIGPDNGLVRLSNVTTNNTTKVSRMVLRHYSNAQLPLYLFGAASTATANFVAFGGGAAIGNAATQIDLFTAPNTTTPTGTSRLTIKGNGYVGIGTQSPTQPLHMASGAHVTVGGVWTNASSREYKEDIETLTLEEASDTLQGLNPVKFAYKADRTEKHVGFVAEEVPELVATKGRKGLSPMDIVAVLTKVVQELKARNEKLEQRLLALEGKGIEGE